MLPQDYYCEKHVFYVPSFQTLKRRRNLDTIITVGWLASSSFADWQLGITILPCWWAGVCD